MGLAAVAVAGPVLVIARAVEAVTVVVADAVLLAAFGSGSLPLIVAVLVMLPPFAGAVVLLVVVALGAVASVLSMQLTPPEALLFPYPALFRSTPAGRVSVTTTPVAPFGPLLVAVRV